VDDILSESGAISLPPPLVLVAVLDVFGRVLGPNAEVLVPNDIVVFRSAGMEFAKPRQHPSFNESFVALFM
jgi:hypothetical protein